MSDPPPNRDPYLIESVSIPEASVGCVDLMTKDNNDNLGFFVRIYYPTKHFTPDSSSMSSSMSWFPPEEEYVNGFSKAKRQAHYPVVGPLFRLMKRRKIRKLVQNTRVAVKPEAPLHTDYGTVPLPVFVMSPALGGSRFTQSSLASAFVLHCACVVLVIEHADGSAAWTQRQNGQIPLQPKTAQRPAMTRVRAQEIISCCDKLLPMINDGLVADKDTLIYGHSFNWVQFMNRLNVLSVAAVGIGAGAAACLTAVAMGCQRIARIITLDATISVIDQDLLPSIADTGLPILFINSEQNTSHETERRYEFMDLNPAKMKMITIGLSKSSHFSDWARFTSELFWMFKDDPIDPMVCDAVVVQCADDFIKQFSPLWPSDQLVDLMKEYIHVPLSDNLMKKLR